MVVGIIDYGAGNIFSVEQALRDLGAVPEIVSGLTNLNDKDALVLPGVGAFRFAMESLSAAHLDEGLREWVRLGRPLLGICLGMQLLFDSSEEGEGVAGLGLLHGSVRRFPRESTPTVPHMGWNMVHFKKGSRLGTEDKYFYFAHSYFCNPESDEIVAGVTYHGVSFPSIVEVPGRRLFGVQFHPEKSGPDGLELLKAFLREASYQC
ncbi:MAG TPA: imidazole glycerol phosphate synthase subunit HisH [Firmicutes bacterium]|nr:imidazole glycerol phosphate synthase subunit HisH [Bacillota bacterium]